MATLVKGDIVTYSAGRGIIIAADGDTAWLRTPNGANVFALVSTLQKQQLPGDNPGGAAGPIPQEDVDRVKGRGPLP